PARRRGHRPGRRRDLHAVAAAAESAGRHRRRRLRRRTVDRPERAMARRPQRVGGRHLSRTADEAAAGVRARVRVGAARPPDAWERVGAVDLACLNAGVLTGESDPRKLTDEQYRHALAVNVDGVVFGVRRLARVMEGGTIVVTASLAGLTAMPSDVVYSLTKHAVVGFVRSVAPLLEPLRINAVCPGIADTAMIDRQRDAFAAAGFPLLRPEEVADAVWLAATS